MPLRTPTRRDPRPAIGLALLALFAAVVVVAYVRPDPFADSRTLRAVFDDAGGFGGKITEVRITGVAVGRVSEVERRGDDAVLSLALDPEAADRVRADASAELRPRIAFEGTAFVELDPGSPSAAPLRGRTITRTRNYVGLFDALRFARPRARAGLRRAVAELRPLLRPDGQRGLQHALRGSPTLVRALAPAARAAQGPDGDELAGVVYQAARTFDAVAAEERSLVPFLRSAASSLEAIDVDEGLQLASTLRISPRALAAMEEGGRALEATIARLEPLARELRPGLAELPATLAAVRPLLREARAPLARAAPLLADLRGALRAGGRGSRAGSRFLRSLTPTFELLDRSLLPALNRETAIGLPAYLALINAFQGGGGSFRAFQDESHGPGRNGDGHFLRFEGRFLTGVGTPVPRCDLLERVNPELAAQLAEQGVCVP